MIRTGQQYLDSIRDTREVYINGERVKDVTRNPLLLAEGHPLAAEPAVSLQDLVNESLVLLDIEPTQDYVLSLFRDRGMEPHVAHRSKSLEMVRGFVGHGLGYSILATKPANSMTYDGRALVARPLTGAVRNSRLVLATRSGRPMSAIALEFAEHCRSLFGANHAH